MLPSENESLDDRMKPSHHEQDRVLIYSDVNNLNIDAFTIEDPGLIDITSEDSVNDVQQGRIIHSSGDVQLLKEDSALDKEVMDREKQFKSKNRKTNSSDTSKKKNVDLKKNTGLTDLNIDAFTIEDPGLIDISSEDPVNDLQQERITHSRGDVQLLKEDSALDKEVMDREKQFKSKNRKTKSSDTSKKKNVDFKKNTGLIGMKISRRDVIIDDVPDVNQNGTNKNTKKKVCNPSSVKVVPERDVYERIIGKAYDIIKSYGNLQRAENVYNLSYNSNSDLKNASNLSANNSSKVSFQTCHKPLEEVSVYKLIDSKRPKKVCRSKSLCIPSVQKTIESEKDVLMISKSHNITKEVDFKDLDDNNSHNSKITKKESTLIQNIKRHSRDKSKSNMMIYAISTPIITPAAKGADAKITGQCGSVKPNIHNRKNLHINIYDHVSSQGSKIIKHSNKEIITKSIDDQDVVNQVAPKVAASISKNRRNTISSVGQITKSTNSEKVTKVKRKNSNPNFDDQITELNLIDEISKPANSDKARHRKIKNDNLNCNNQLKILKDATITKLNNEKAVEVTKDKMNAKSNRHTTNSSVDVNTKSDGNERPIENKRKLIHIIDDQVLTSFVPKVAASVSNKRRNTVSSICPEKTSLKVCSKSIFRDDKIIPHYHTCLFGNQTGEKNKDDKTIADTKTTPVKLTQDKSPSEVNPGTRIEGNENNENSCNDNNTASLSRSKPSVPVVVNKNIIVIESTKPNIDFSLNALPSVLPQPFPKFDSTINENVSKEIDIPDMLNTEKNTEQSVRTFDSVPRETIPVVLNMVPCPNQRNGNKFSSSFPIQSVVSNRPLQESQINICLRPRTPHTVFPRLHRLRPWQATYPSNYNQFSSVPNNRYPILNRLMNAGTFVRNSYNSRTLPPPPKFQHSPPPILPLYRLNSPYLPTTVLNTSPKDTQVVNINDCKEKIKSKINNPSNEAPAVENTANGKEINSSVKQVKISEAETVDRPPVKRSQTENINILNNTKAMTHTEQKTSERIGDEEKPPEKVYSPAIMPILSFPKIFDILETSQYDYPNLKTSAYNRTEWINKDTNDRSNLDTKKRKMNGDGTPDSKKGKISISEYKKRLAVTATKEND